MCALATAIAACTEPAPGVRDVAGEWVFTEYIGAEIDQAVLGSLVLTQNGTAFSGTVARYVGGCDANCLTPPLSVITDGQISDTGITFTAGLCRYGAAFKGGSDSLFGYREQCTRPVNGLQPNFEQRGPWWAARAGVPASLTLLPGRRIIVVGGTVRLEPVLADAAGHRLYGRSLTWSSDGPGVASLSAPDSLTAVVSGAGQGTARVTVTAAGLSAGVDFTVSLVSYTSISAGGFHTCGIGASGSAWCWGQNEQGELGDSVNGFVASFGRTGPGGVLGGLAFSAVSAAPFQYSCGLTTAGAAYCWGENLNGRLGNGGTAGGSAVPVPVAGGLQFTALATGGDHSCALTPSGAAYCWGANDVGQLGDGSAVASPVPTAVSGGLQFASLSAGLSFTCGLTVAGAAYCWGIGGAGALGNSATANSTVPVAVAGGLQFSSLSAGSFHICGVTTGGVAYCWGSNYIGQLGDSTFTSRSAPVAVAGGLQLASVSAGSDHTCGVTTGGQAWCWGDNFWGELGDGTTTVRRAPVAVLGGLQFGAVSSGTSHTCGITTAGRAFCWGTVYSELGNTAPSSVLGQP